MSEKPKSVLALQYTTPSSLWKTAVNHLRGWLAHKIAGVQTTTMTWDVDVNAFTVAPHPLADVMLRELARIDDETMVKLLRAEAGIFAGAPAMRAVRAWQNEGCPMHVASGAVPTLKTEG